MGRFGGLDKFEGQASNPAAPSGARDLAQGGGGGGNRFASGGRALQQWGEPDYERQAQSWFSGRNTSETTNGWDTTFVSSFQTKWDVALSEGKARDYFAEANNPTGVVTWDHTTSDGTTHEFGDVYENGKKTGNLYDLYDRKVADLMMTPWVLDNDAQANAFSSEDRDNALHGEIVRAREERNKNFEDSLKALEFGGDVEKREKAFREGFVDEALVGGGAVGGAALATGLVTTGGALAGTGVGVVPGAIVAAGGAAVGGVAAYLNRDSLTEQAARAYEISKMSFEENGALTGAFTALGQTAGVAGKLITPTSNLVQGLYDTKRGDGESKFYRTDKHGNNVAPTWMRVLDVGAGVVDSLAQFASPVGLAAYTAQMSGTIGGEVGELATSGKTFDYRSAQFDNIFTDEDGNFDASSAAAGIAKVGIDAVQLGMARGLAGKASASLAGVSGQSAEKGFLGRQFDRLRGTRANIAAGERNVEAAGYRFIEAADGSIVEGSRRATLSILAPSEQLAALSARVTASRAAARRGGAYSADDFYKAASGLAAGERKISSALVNGFGEGYEEAVQAVLEPHSHQHSIDGEEVGWSFLYGTAAGVGMGLGSSARGASAEDQLYALANLAHMKFTGGEALSREEFNSLSETEKRGRAALSRVDMAVAQAAYDKMAADQATDVVDEVAGAAKLHDAIQAKFASDLKHATARTDAPFVITQIENTPQLDSDGNLLPGEIGMDAAVASGPQTAQNFVAKLKGVEIQLGQLREELAKLDKAKALDDDAQIRRDSVEAQVGLLEASLSWGERLYREIDAAVQRMVATPAGPGRLPAIEAEAAEINDLLRRAYDGRIGDYAGEVLSDSDRAALQRAASAVFIRNPQDSAGSYQVLVPQISARLTDAGSHNILEISHAILTPIRGDYDGDKLIPQNQLILDETEFVSARAGMHYVGAGDEVAIGTPKYEKPIIVDAFTPSLSGSMGMGLQMLATNTMTQIGDAVKRRYANAIPRQVLDGVVEQFYDRLRAGDKDARSALINGLAREAGGPLTEFARGLKSNEWLWLDQLLVSNMQRFQEVYASRRPRTAGVNPTEVSPIRQSTEVRTRRAQKAATPGQTLGLTAPGDSLFRMFQKLHYSTPGANVESARRILGDSGGIDLMAQAQFYRELGQSVTATELERLAGMDDIVANVYAQLEKIADSATELNPKMNRHEALAVVANMRVENIDVAVDGTVSSTGKGVSLAQLLLKQAIIRDKRDKQRIANTPELQAKWAKLESMTRPGHNGRGSNAEMAFVEIVGSQQFYTLLGDAATVFGPHQTVEQFTRYFTSLSSSRRQELYRETLAKEPEYLGRRRPKNIPYDLDDVIGDDGNVQISAFRSVVDAIWATANGRISMDSEGKLEGEMADRSKKVSDDFMEFHENARRALREFARDTGVDTSSTDAVAALLAAHPDFARSLMDLIPNAAAAAAFRIDKKTGKVYISNWVYSMLTIKDAKHAEMHYWRNVLIAQWNASGIKGALQEEGEEGEAARRYDRLSRRMHRVMYRLAKANDGGLRYQQFIRELEEATDLETFMTWVNLQPSVKGMQAPLVAWVDDPAEFDADKAGGGWTTMLQGTELREAVRTLKQRTENLVDQLVEERAAWRADVRTMASIRRVMRKDAGEDVRLDSGDREMHDAYVRSVEQASKWASSVGPMVMIQQTLGALRTFYTQAHTKGVNPPNVAAPGTFEATRDNAYGFVTNYERMLYSLTSASLEAVNSNMGELIKDDMRLMDEHGRPVEWTKPSPAQLLDMLENKATRPLARAILFPQVTEVDSEGRLSQKLLVGKSLTNLVTNNTFRDLFKLDGSLGMDSALRYDSMVEGLSQKYGKRSFDLQRAVNDIVIARTSAATHTLTEYENEQMVGRAYHEVAEVLQVVGNLLSQADGEEQLTETLKLARTAQRRVRVSKILGLSKIETDEVTDELLDELLLAREYEMVNEVEALSNKIARDPDNVAVYEAELEAKQAQHAQFTNRIDMLRSDDYVGQVVDMFLIDPANHVNEAAKKDALLDFVASHLDMLQRVSSIKPLMLKVTNMMRDAVLNDDLTGKEWNELSRAAIGVYLDDAAVSSAAGVSVSPWPDADAVGNEARYFDTTWSYLAEALLDPKGSLAQAARELHLTAGRAGITPATRSDLLSVLDRTIFDSKRLGPWTSDVKRASVEANSRLDSAAAETALPINGNPPKRQAAIIGASRRTTLAPDTASTSQALISWYDLNGPEFDEIQVELPSKPGEFRSMPVAQLNGRFSNGATVVLPDGSELNLFNEVPDTSRAWTGDEEVRYSGWGHVNVKRLQRSLAIVAQRYKLPVEQLQIRLDFVHPDDITASEDYANNVYYEGVSFELDGDRHESLISTLWFANNSISPAGQAQALDASKLGMSAFQVIPTTPAARRRDIEANWQTDFAGMLREKTRQILETDLGFGKLDIEFYNAVYKDMKLRHYVRGEVDGVPVLWRAEQVLAAQRNGEPLPDNASLWIPSDDVLRTMLGEQGTQGVAHHFVDQLEVNPALVKTFRKITPEMVKLFSAGVEGQSTTLDQTRVASRARQSLLRTGFVLDDKMRNAFDEKMRYFNALESSIHADRALKQTGQPGAFNTVANMNRALQAASSMVRAEDLTLLWARLGVPFGPRSTAGLDIAKATMRDLAGAIISDGNRSGWVYEEGSAGKPAEGTLSQVNLSGGDVQAFHLAPRDFVTVMLDSFAGDVDLAKKRLDFMANRGAIVALGAGDGTTEMRATLGAYLEELGYERVIGTSHIYQPLEFNSRFQNTKARVSTLTAMEGMSARSRVAVLNVQGYHMQEGAAWINEKSERNGAISDVANLIPSSAYAGFNVPATPRQIDRVRTKLIELNRRRDVLKSLLNEGGDSDFDDAYDRLMQRFDTHPEAVLPQPGDTFGKGDIIPLVDMTGRILLYRHGYKGLTRDAINRQTLETMIDGNELGVAIYTNKREGAASIQTGEIVEVRQRAGYGLVAEMLLPLQLHGDKRQLEWNGMKYVTTPMSKDITLPDHGFFENWQIDMISDLQTGLSKESVGDMVDNHRTAFAVFGIDFLPDVARVFFPDEVDTSGEPTASALSKALEVLRSVAERKEQPLSFEAADELIKAQSFSPTLREMLPIGYMKQAQGLDDAWAQALQDQNSPSSRITAALLTYLMTPGAQVADVLSSGGFNDTQANQHAESQRMPYLFTQVFDLAPIGSPLRLEINRRLNDQLFNPDAGRQGYILHENFEVEVIAPDGRRMFGVLQFPEAHSSGDNPIRNGMAYDDAEKGAVSQHTAQTAYGALGAETAMAFDLTKAQAFLDEAATHKDLRDGGAWRMLTDVPARDRAFESYRLQTPAELERRENAREAMVAFRSALVTSDELGWSDRQRNEYKAVAKRIMRQLNLHENQAELVDYWVRQTLGRPRGEGENGEKLDRITGKAALEAANDISWYVSQGYLPTLGAMVPALHLHDLQVIYRANQNEATPWRPRESMDGSSGVAHSWNDWVNVSLGSMLTSDNLFDPLYLLALDGFMHSYQNAVGSLLDLPVSVSTLISQHLLDPDLNDMVVSIQDQVNLVAKNPAMVETLRADLDTLLGGVRIAGKVGHKAAPASEVAKRRKALREWRMKNDVPLPVDTTLRDFRKNGGMFVDAGTNTNALTRIFLNLRVGTALLNPQLYISMGPEQWVRGGFDRLANMLTGDATTGLSARLTSRYTPEQLADMHNLYTEMGQRSDFKKMIYGEIAYQQAHGEHGVGKVEKFFEGYAKFGSRVQDPTWGVRAATPARRYVEAALAYIARDPIGTTLTADTLVAALSTDPTFLKKNHPQIHRAASNSVAQIRSLKQTSLNLALRGVFEPAWESQHGAINTMSNILTRVPLMFSNYLTNVVTTLLGLQGLDQMWAAFKDNKPKSTLIGRVQAAIRGEEFNAEDDARYDYSSVLEGIDLSRAFIRGGLTHTGLFAFGLMAGGLGLSGEDDEMKKRRRLSEAQGVGILYDPRRLENDFRNADAVYLDWMPFGLGSMLTGGEQEGEGAERAVGELHWMLRQFISPIIGMEKFFETGDSRHIKWGFEDALGAFPLINTTTLQQASDTFDMLQHQALEAGDKGDFENSVNFLVTAVGTYERMLFESSFANQVYVGMDDYDRDPYTMPLRDSDGELQRDIEGNVRSNDVATTQFITEGPDGKPMVQTGYLDQRDRVTDLKVLSENRASLALVLSLFSGGPGDSQYWRYNMPIKTRDIEKQELSKDLAEVVMRRLYAAEGAQPNLTADELSSIWKNEAAKAGKFVSWDLLDRQAVAYIERLKKGQPVDLTWAPSNPLMPEPMSVLDAEGREELTKAGARGVFNGLLKGTVKRDDPALKQLYIPYEMRQEILEEWTREIIQDGVDMGLDRTKATYRAKRILGGEYNTTQVGLGDILFAKADAGGPSYTKSNTYMQLNTTYVIGPDGLPWATGFKREGVFGALGLKPVKGLMRPEHDGMGQDKAGNAVDLVNGLNTGLRGLEPVDASRNVPTDEEIAELLKKAIEDAGKQDYTPNTPATKSGSGYGGYGGYGFRRYRRGGYGGYGGGGGGGGAYFQKMYALPDGFVPYANDISFINTNTPSPRRAFVRRERVESQRGRLKQWQ